MKKEFKLKGKKFYLTYKVNKHINNKKEKILQQLIYKFIYIDRYIIGEEYPIHDDSICIVHCFIDLKTSFETTSESFFDIYLDQHIHGNYKVGLRKKRIIEFIKNYTHSPLQKDIYLE